MADGYVAGFQSKYDLNSGDPSLPFARAIQTVISRTLADPAWSSFLNTPPVPDYTSTHSVLGGAAGRGIAPRFFRSDNIFFHDDERPSPLLVLSAFFLAFRGRRRERSLEDLCRHSLPVGS